MIDAQVLLDRLQSDANTSSYTSALARSIQPNLQDIASLPYITVGYHSITSLHPKTPIDTPAYDLHGESLVQYFEVNFVSLVENVPAVWQSIYKALIGYNPFLPNDITSAFKYVQGGRQGEENSRVWHTDVWSIGFPTMIHLF